MRELDIDVIHAYLLDIAKEFDRICTKHNIPYYMIGGTMLGAIRHKGFIPWDDDMDFGVPIEYYKELATILEEELRTPYRLCTYLNHPAVIYNFFKIENLSTCIGSDHNNLPPELQIGINIDVFPLSKSNPDDKSWDKIRRRILVLSAFENTMSQSCVVIRKIVKLLLRTLSLGNHVLINKSIDKILFRSNNGDFFGNSLGRWGKKKELMPFEWFGKGIRYDFEDTSFVGPEKYDEYLTNVYGNYLELPPKDKQQSHVKNIYLR